MAGVLPVWPFFSRRFGSGGRCCRHFWTNLLTKPVLGALNILAELEEHSPLFEAFRKAGLSSTAASKSGASIESQIAARLKKLTGSLLSRWMKTPSVIYTSPSHQTAAGASAEACPESQEQCLFTVTTRMICLPMPSLVGTCAVFTPCRSFIPASPIL